MLNFTKPHMGALILNKASMNVLTVKDGHSS